jgi:hypothetical protein
MGEPCGRSNQLIMYFIRQLLDEQNLRKMAVWTGQPSAHHSVNGQTATVRAM